MTIAVHHDRVLPPDHLPAVRALVERARVHDGVAPFSDDLWTELAGARTRAVLRAVSDRDELIGLAFTADQGARHAAEALVDPGHRGHGYGATLVAELLGGVDGELWLWAHGDHPAARALALRHHLERARELLQLRRPLGADAPALPDPPLPAGIEVRPFRPGQDEAAWLAVNNAAFSWHPEQGRMTTADIRAAESEPWFDPAGFFLAFAGDDLVGFHWTKVHATDPSPPPGTAESGPIGEVYVVGVSPEAHGGGIGSALTAIGLRHLAALGLDTVMLYVEGDNDAALTVYRRLGFHTHQAHVAYRRP